jgi:phosphoglucosamine mutase
VAFRPSFTHVVATALGAAAARVIPVRAMLVARDPRESGGARCGGRRGPQRARRQRPELLGVVPTPALAFLAAREACPAAMITASHNRFTDNGVKVFARGGLKLPDDVEEEIEAALADDAATAIASSAMARRAGEITHRTAAVDDYVRRLETLFPSHALAGVRVTLDCANGAMSEAAPLAFERLGANVTVIHASPDGRNINDACGATAPSSLSAAVVSNASELGIALDGDGDRVIAADHPAGSSTATTCWRWRRADARLGDLADDTLVVTVMSNLGLRLAMQRAGIAVSRPPSATGTCSVRCATAATRSVGSRAATSSSEARHDRRRTPRRTPSGAARA